MKWYLHPIVVIILLFFVLGPFALPLLYKSPGFSKYMKILLTVAVSIYTIYLIVLSIQIAQNVADDMTRMLNVVP